MANQSENKFSYISNGICILETLTFDSLPIVAFQTFNVTRCKQVFGKMMTFYSRPIQMILIRTHLGATIVGKQHFLLTKEKRGSPE